MRKSSIFVGIYICVSLILAVAETRECSVAKYRYETGLEKDREGNKKKS